MKEVDIPEEELLSCPFCGEDDIEMRKGHYGFLNIFAI